MCKGNGEFHDFEILFLKYVLWNMEYLNFLRRKLFKRNCKGNDIFEVE